MNQAVQGWRGERSTRTEKNDRGRPARGLVQAHAMAEFPLDHPFSVVCGPDGHE